MIDTHSHINADIFDDDREDMLLRARESGVELIIVPDIEPGRRSKLRDIVDAHSFLYRGIGIHPHHAGEVTQNDIDDVEAQCKESKVVAIGEIGLDYHYDFCSPDVQKLYFREQIRIAKRHDLPIIVHNREADTDVLDIIEEEQDGSLRGVLHCFSSDASVLDRALQLNMHISFTGNITFRKSTLNEVVQRVPLDRVMIETDAPYMTPVPHRGQRNEPLNVRLVAEKLAEIKSMSLMEVLTTTSSTARKLFALTCALLMWAISANAQPKKPNDEDFDNDTRYEIALENYEVDSIGWAKFIKPRTFGFGITVGSNTVVEQQTFRQRYFRAIQGTAIPQRWETFPSDSGPSRSFSYNGLLSFGATVMFQASDRIAFEATYLYTKNEGDRALYGLPPVVTNIVEGVFLYSLNPYNKVNFVPQAGVTFASQSDGRVSSAKFGCNLGMGIGMNIPTSFGLLYPMINVRFNFMFGTSRDATTATYPVLSSEDQTYIVEDPDRNGVYLHYNPLNPSQTSIEKADVTTIYSIPRLSIMFYPKF
ncbi:MAG: TatD family hydrolase [Candidatus Kapabacteria bacterium]|nr:TatD family hydrolase [Candidatus Kapabacteria bacterium]